MVVDDRAELQLILKSVNGIIWKADDDTHSSPPTVSAAVAFKGSAADMQVSSFTMCGRTGQIVIESNPMEFDKNSNRRDELSLDTEFPICFNFNDPMENYRVPASGSSSDSSSVSSLPQPHMKFLLQEQGLESTTRSLGVVNRESKATSSLSFDPAVVPEIVELHVTLRTEDYSVCEEGIAHLVLYGGQTEPGITTMDLKLKRKSFSNNGMKQEGKPRLVFQPDAFVRIQVNLVGNNIPVPEQNAENATEESNKQVAPDTIDKDEKVNIIINNSTKEDEGERNVAGGERKELAAARAKATKIMFQDEQGAANTELQNKMHHPKPFCHGAAELKNSFHAFFDAFRRCHMNNTNRRHKKPWQAGGGLMKQRMGQGGPCLRTNSTMESTIATRESLLI